MVTIAPIIIAIGLFATIFCGIYCIIMPTTGFHGKGHETSHIERRHTERRTAERRRQEDDESWRVA